MNDQTDDLDRVDEEILTSTLSDEALEAAACLETGRPFPSASPGTASRCYLCC
jgi:hypothetical protein